MNTLHYWFFYEQLTRGKLEYLLAKLCIPSTPYHFRNYPYFNKGASLWAHPAQTSINFFFKGRHSQRAVQDSIGKGTGIPKKAVRIKMCTLIVLNLFLGAQKRPTSMTTGLSPRHFSTLGLRYQFWAAGRRRPSVGTNYLPHWFHLFEGKLLDGSLLFSSN